MCGCEAHWDLVADCTCVCSDHKKPHLPVGIMEPDFSPELGQSAFSNTAWQSWEAYWAESGLRLVQEALDSVGKLSIDWDNKSYEGSYFSFRPYCWCDGTRRGHEAELGGCPPNFVVPTLDLTITFYKHVGRSLSANVSRRPADWYRIVATCLEEVLR